MDTIRGSKSHWTHNTAISLYPLSFNLNNLAFLSLRTIAGHSQDTIKFKSKKRKLFSSQFRF